MAEKKKTWTPGSGGSKSSQDYYKKAKSEYRGRQPKKTEYKKTKQTQNIPSKKEWYAEKSDPTQHKFANENQRLIEKYAAKGKDFTKTDQYRTNMEYLDNVTVNRGGNRGRIYSNDPTLNTGNEVGDAYRRSLLRKQGVPGKMTQLGVQGILDIDPYKARLGLENDPNSFFRFNQQLMEKNPAAYEQARPWGSGKAVRGLASLALPAPLKMLGTMAKDVAGLGARGLKALVPKGMKKDLGSEWRRLKSNFPSLTNEQNKLLNIQIEEGKGKDVDITEQIQRGFHDDTSWQDEMVKESGLVSDEVYDENVDPNYWSHGYTLPLQQDPGFDEEYEEIRDTQYMPNVPINQAGKEDYLRQLIGAEQPISPGNVDQLYDYARRKESEGQTWDQQSGQWQEKPTAGTFDLSTQDNIFDVGGNQEQLDEVREQIDQNTANRPLGTNLWQPPELTEDFIQENIGTGSDLWQFNQGGYLKKFDDGGYANMSTFEKLKAINDSIAED